MVVGGLGQHGDGVAGSLYLLSPIKLFLESLVMAHFSLTVQE